MEPYGKKGNFVGYGETSKSFKIYVPGERHVEVSREVNFQASTTPEEDFTCGKLDISHLRIFGCPVYIHIPKEKRTKM